jgi:hypothetical protein
VRPAPTVSNSEFIGQTEAVARGGVQGTLTMVGCRFAMATDAPAIQLAGNSPESTPAIIDSIFEYPDGKPAAAVVNPAQARPTPGFYLENCYIKNAASLDGSEASALNKTGWHHIERAARTRRDRVLEEPLRVPGGENVKWIAWNKTNPRCAMKDGQPLFDGKPVQLPENATWKEDAGGGIQVAWTLGEPVVIDGKVSFASHIHGKPVEPGPYWETMRRTHLYRRELGIDTPGLVSVKTFGAVGDGETDETDALRKAVASGKDLLLPRGIYRYTGTLELRPGQTLVGADLMWSLLRGSATSNAGSAAAPILATAAGDAANNTLADLGIGFGLGGWRGAPSDAATTVSAFQFLVQGGGCELVDVTLSGASIGTPPPPVLQVASGGGVNVYNGCFVGGRNYPREGVYLQIQNQRHPVRFYHLQIQGPNGFGLLMSGSTGGMRAYGVKTEHGTHCLMMAENSRNFGWYGYGAGGAPTPDRRDYGDLPAANYRIENCDDFVVAAYSHRMQHPAFLTYDAIREVRKDTVMPLERAFRPILYQRGNPPLSAPVKP